MRRRTELSFCFFLDVDGADRTFIAGLTLVPMSSAPDRGYAAYGRPVHKRVASAGFLHRNCSRRRSRAARFISRRGQHSYVRSGKTLLSLVACGHQRADSTKAQPHTYVRDTGRLSPLPTAAAPTFELATCIRYDSQGSSRACGASCFDQDLPNKAATTCWMCGTLQS